MNLYQFKNACCVLVLAALLFSAYTPAPVLAEETEDASDKEVIIVHEVKTDYSGYVLPKLQNLYEKPSDTAQVAVGIRFGAMVSCIGECDNGFLHVEMETGGKTYRGYVPEESISLDPVIQTVQNQVTVGTDCEVLDYPSRRDGEPVGEVLEEDTVVRTGTVNEIWSRISYEEHEEKKSGYILTTCLRGYEDTQASSKKDGSIHKSKGEGIFAEAVDGVTEANVFYNGTVLIGTPQSVGETVSLKSLGVFRITHYCPCSICCGPYADGITSTGLTAVTNHTIAVDPTQIPYGSQVVINGQLYVAEDCGGAIKTNCIDVYVATHEEALEKGVFYTEVYLVQ